MNVYSNAFNFSSYLSGGVDLRTGQYTSTLNLVTITPEGGIESSRNITMTFSMLAQENVGYGYGWRLSNTKFTENSRQLRLLSGEVYTTDPLPAPNNSIVVIRDYKLKDMVVRRPEVNTLHVIYKEGTVEILKPPRQGDPYAIAQIIFENGETFSFNYNASGLLASVRNESSQRTLLTINYSNSLPYYMDVLKEGGRFARTYFVYNNLQLTRITVPVESHQTINPATAPAFTYQYRIFSNGLRAIEQFGNPMGGKDVIYFTENGLAYYQGAFIPAVNRVESFGGSGAPSKVNRYSYSQGTNFTGYPFSGGYSPDSDSLYLQNVNYEYWAKEETLDPNNLLQSKERWFNRFHLLTREKTTRAGKIFEQKYLYNEIIGPFTAQPANLFLPRQVTTRYEADTYREEIERIETDVYGNTLSRTDPSGIRQTFSYYPIGGTAGSCPPEPHGLFQRFVSTESIFPASGSLPAKVTVHTYKEIDNYARTRKFVLPATATYAGTLKDSFNYLEDYQRVALHGRISQSAMLLNGYTTTTQFTYQLSGDKLTETRTVTGFDSTSLTTRQSSSVVTQWRLETTKDAAVNMVFAYDINGRVISETLSPSTVNAAVRQYAYTFASTGQLPYMVTTDALGAKSITRYDGFSRHVSTSQKNGTAELLIRSNTYNYLGQLATETVIDRPEGTTLTLFTQYQYDGWGRLRRTVRPDGSALLDDYDPILRKRIEGVEGTTLVLSYQNDFDKVVRQEQRHSNGVTTQLLVSRTFDGFGRCLSETDINNHRIEYSYDIFDRLITERSIPADSTPARTVETTYAPQCVERLKTSIKVNQVLIGTQTYDGVGRLVNLYRGNGQAAGKTPETFSYRNNSTRPVSLRSPTGVLKNFQYNTQLDALTQVSGGNITNNFGFGSKTGLLESATTREGTNRTRQYDGYGWPSKDTQVFNSQTYANTYRFSPAGRLSSLTSAVNDVEQRHYDSAGRFSSANIGSANILFQYDSYSRLSQMTTTANSRSIAEKVIYDGYGREETRETRQSGNLLQTQKFTYHPNGQMASRQLTGATGSTIIQESFTYDAYRRLTRYTCTGPEYSIDQSGRAIRSQQFTYDALNNITRVISAFLNQSNSDDSQRYFESTDPTQLTRVTHTNPAQTILLSYDAAGQLSSDNVRVYRFDDVGQLIELSSGGSMLSRYNYDGTGRQLGLSDANNTVALHYDADNALGASQGSNKTRYIRHEQSVLARSMASGTELYATDMAQSVTAVISPTNVLRRTHYSPYGMSDIDANAASSTLLERCRPAYNGERYDPIGRLYHLGNGVRAYSPELMIFLSPDPISPFGEGGMNSYAYCGGDPINQRDPSGMMPMWLQWTLVGAGIALSVASLWFTFGGSSALTGWLLGVAITGAVANLTSLGLTIASASIGQINAINGTDHSNITRRLDIATLAFGLLGLAAGFSNAAMVAKNSYLAARSYRYTSYYRYSEGELRQVRDVFPHRVGFAAGARNFVNEFIAYQRQESILGRYIGRLVSSTGNSTLDIFNASYGLVNTVGTSQPDNNVELFDPAFGRLSGVLGTVRAFEREFQTQSQRLRGSAIMEAYSRTII